MAEQRFKVVSADDVTKAEGRAKECAEILEELARVQAGLLDGSIKGLGLIVLEASGECYPVIHQLGDLAGVVGHLELAKQAIILGSFAGDDADDGPEDEEPAPPRD